MIYSPSGSSSSRRSAGGTSSAGGNDLNILAQVRKAHVPPIARYHSGVRPALARVVEHSSPRNPTSASRRPPEFAHAIREAIAPTTEPEALNDLRAFVADIYGRLISRSTSRSCAEASTRRSPERDALDPAAARASRTSRGRSRRGLTVTVAAAIIFVLGAAAFVA